MVLGVDRNATPDEVRRAFRQQVQERHPDHGGSEAEFRRVKNAKEAMLDE
nr:DnaJ domain-containing protein [Halorussus sp. JP-T4]